MHTTLSGIFIKIILVNLMTSNISDTFSKIFTNQFNIGVKMGRKKLNKDKGKMIKLTNGASNNEAIMVNKLI